MLIKDLTKFANLTENRGVLPTKVEWLLDEFANCPPLDAIETTISVARSRGMRFFFFIQSFSQLDQVYGKDTASIIVDNCALQYLKTNSVECAERIAKKLGKSTVETNSMSMSTDPFKVGANQTKSLMGKELLTATEIISLKYKTIIFPTFGNPIFRDTYLYSDVYPQYKNYPILERKVSVLKRLNENYYTVEKLREYYDKKTNSGTGAITKKIEQSYQRQINRSKKKIMSGIEEQDVQVNSLEQSLEQIRNFLGSKITKESYINDTYIFEINGILNRFEKTKLLNIKDKSIILEFGKDSYNKKTIISVWSDVLEMKGI